MLEFWTEVITQSIGGFLVVLVGTMFLFGEVLVKGKGILGVVGIALISLYFITHMQEGQVLWMGLLYIIGISLVMLDGKFIGDGTVAAIGLIIMLIALALPSPDLFYGISVASAFIIGSIGSSVFLKFLPRRDLWSKLTLKDTMSSERGYNSVNESYLVLLGKTGVAETRFNPTGTIKIEGKLYSASSEGRWIEKGAPLKVKHISGTRILVEEIEDDEHSG